MQANEKETESTNQEKTTVATTASSTQAQTTTVKATEKATEKVTEKVTQKATTQATTKAAADSANKDSVKVVLSDINYSGKAAQILADAGVVDDATAFNKYLSANGYATKIVDGTYTFTKGQDYESVAKAITKKIKILRKLL